MFSLSAESLLGWAQDLLQTQLFSEDWLTQSNNSANLALVI
jgi:hypothetical protein